MEYSFAKYCNALVLPAALISSLIGCASAPTRQASSQPQSSAATPASGSDLGIYQKGNVAPFALYLGSPNNWTDMLSGPGANHGTIKVEPGQVTDPDDGKKVTWTGIGQIYAQSKSLADRKSYLDADSALVFDMVVHEPPQGSVTVRVDCKYPCAGAVEAAAHFKSLPVGKKSTVKIPLGCFEAAGTQFGNVNTPFLVFASSRFVASFANIRWVKGAGKDADVVKCKRR